MKKTDTDKIPKHVAIIMDGNRRWARKNGLSVIAGHDFVSEKVLEPLVDRAIEVGISYLTFWAFSTENWERDKREVEGMIKIFRRGLLRSAERLHRKGVRLRIIGDLKKFPQDIASKAKEWVEISQQNKKITVCFALNYGGRDEIIRAIKKLNGGGFKVNEEDFEKLLDTKGMPEPDLIIRTGGEQRLSGFMLWQSAYSELYFTEVLMPDFSGKEFDKAILNYKQRSRRFGR